jgi:mono/diheme cytochrome c family protein
MGRSIARGWIVFLGLACGDDRDSWPPMVTAATPEEHRRGELLYERTCEQCHGPRASGSDVAPPLVHRIYEPSHHADEAFYRAIRFGVRAHHFRFGDMPPQPDVTDDEARAITAYVRWLQEEAGIN